MSILILNSFKPNKCYAYLLNVDPSYLVFLKTCNTEFDQIFITFTDQHGRSLEIEDRDSLTLLIDKQKWCVNLLNKKQENTLNDTNFYHFHEIFLTNIENNYWIETIFFKNASKKWSIKQVNFQETKSLKKIVKSKHVIDENLGNVKEIYIPKFKVQGYDQIYEIKGVHILF